MANPRSVLDMVRERFGFRVLEREDAEVSQVGTSDTIIARSNSRRLVLLVVNLSSNNIFIRPGRAAASTTGIQLDGNGGFFVAFFPDDFTLPTQEWHAVASGASSDLYVFEILMDVTEVE